MKRLNQKALIAGFFATALMFGAFANEASAAVCKPSGSSCVESVDIIDGQVTTPDIGNAAVTTPKLQDNAVTGAKVMDGSLTGADVQDGSLTRADVQPVAHRVVVASSGGDYTSINAALAAINPTASDPYVIDVMPGTYVENVTMKSYVHLRGAGRDVTTIQALDPSGSVISLVSLTKVMISGFTITGGSPAGIYNPSSEADVRNNLVTGNTGNGIFYSTGFASGVIAHNIVTNNSNCGICLGSSSPLVIGNTLTNNSRGISAGASSSIIEGNVITGSSSWGVLIQSSGSLKLIHNVIIGNGTASGQPDIEVQSAVPLISFNVYDTINGTGGVGNYNVTSNGDPAPAP